MSAQLTEEDTMKLAHIMVTMYGTTRWGDRALYHGTSLTALSGILAEGLKPRGNGGGNWHSTVKSNPDAVYLTNAYPLFFAQQATKRNRRHVILEVNIEKIQYRLQADEDAVEQSMRGKDKLPEHWDIKRRTIYYRNRTHLYRSEASLAVLGTCGHRGVIAPGCIERVAVIDPDTVTKLIVFGLDPVLSVLNYELMGDSYRDWCRWLFDEARHKEQWVMPKYRPFLEQLARTDMQLPRISKEGIRIYPNIEHALKGEV